MKIAPITEAVAKAILAAYNNSMTGHLHFTPLTYEEVVNDPRYGIIISAEAAIEAVRKFDAMDN